MTMGNERSRLGATVFGGMPSRLNTGEKERERERESRERADKTQG